MDDGSRIGIIWGIVGVVFGLVVMFGGRAVLGGDHWYVIWPAMVLVFSIQSGRIAFQKGVSRKEPH